MFKEDYQAAFSKVTASEETYRRVMNMTKKKKTRSIGGLTSKILIAAVMVSLLVVTASAAEYVRGWFTTYFSESSEMPLSDEQMQYIEENEQHIAETQSKNGWTIELRSAISDSMKGYIMLGVTAPADVSLEEIPQESKQEYYGPRNEYLPKDSEAVLTCSAYSGAGVIANIAASWQEDGDGLSNTLNYVIRITSPDIGYATTDPFGSDAKWHIHMVDLVRGFSEQELLAEGTWDFDFTFEKNETEIELLTDPIKTMGVTFDVSNPPDMKEIQIEVPVKSIILRPFGVTVYYGDDSDGVDYETADIHFADDFTELSPWQAVMEDGTKMPLIDLSGDSREGYRYLESELPIVLEKVDYILLSDGTKLPVPKIAE